MANKAQDAIRDLIRYMKPRAEHFNEKLPYRLYNPETCMYNNADSLGFGKELTILSGANDEIADSFNNLIASKLPAGDKWQYQFVMTGDHKIQEQLDYNRQLHAQLGGIYGRIAQYASDYADMAATRGFSNNIGRQAWFDLKNYRAFMFVTTTEKSPERLQEVREDIETELNTAGLRTRDMGPEALMNYTRNILNHNLEKTSLTQSTYNPDEYLCKQMMHMNTRINRIEQDYIDIEFQDETCSVDEHRQTRVVCLSLSRLPQEFRLYQMPALLASSRELGSSLKCPFTLSLNFQIEKPEKAKTDVQKKLASLRKWQSSPMRVFMPFVDEEVRDYDEIQKGLLEDYYSLCLASIDLVLYTTPDTYKTDTAMAVSLFRKQLEVATAEMMQAQVLLNVLPFKGIDIFSDIRRAGRAHRMKSSNVAHMMPVVAEWKASYYGVLAPAARNQLAYFTPFNFGTDNYNVVVAGASGSGKSVLVQTIVDDVIARGGIAYINDMGQSYQRTTEIKNGVYMDYRNIRLNPFTHLNKDELSDEDFANSIDMITGLIATMVSPKESIDNFRYAIIKKAVVNAYEDNRQATTIDDVVDKIREEAKTAREVEGIGDRRITDLLEELRPYMTTGEYGAYFNEPSVMDPDKSLFCLEVNGFPEAILRPVMFAQIINISNRIYIPQHQGPPREQLFVIEEAWATLDSDNETIKAAVEKALRTFRKHMASLIVVTQNVQDFFQSSLAQTIYEISDIKIILRQGQAFASFAHEHPNLFDPWEVETIKNFLPSSKAGFSSFLIKTGSYASEHRLFLDPYARMMTTTNPREMAVLDQYRQKGYGIEEAIEQAARDCLPEEMSKLQQFRQHKYRLVQHGPYRLVDASTTADHEATADETTEDQS